MSHASCELQIDFKHPDTPPILSEVAKTILVNSDEYLLSKQGELLNIELRKKIIKKNENLNLRSLSIYLSLYPGKTDTEFRIFGSISPQKITEFTRNRFENNELAQSKDYAFSKSFASLNDKEELKTGRHPNLESITLHEINCESILLDLSRFIIFKYDENDGLISVLNAKDESRYFLFDIFKDHVNRDKMFDFEPEHVCSTLVARVLRNGLGDTKYAELVEDAKNKLKHRIAYPELVFEVAKLAELRENKKDRPKP